MDLSHLARPIDFRALSAPDVILCDRVAQRAYQLGQQIRARNPLDACYEINPEITRIDMAVVALRRGYNLHALMQCDALTFLSEFSAIQMHINRPCKFFPDDVPLRFASTGAILKPH